MLTPTELRDLSDVELLALIRERSGLEGEQAREALAILRGDLPVTEAGVSTRP